MGIRRVLTRILAIVHVLVGAVCSLVAIPFIGIFLLNEPTGDTHQQGWGLEFLPLFLVYFGPSLVAGIGLLFGARWARRLLAAQAVAYLFLIPLGTALGIATLALLFELPKPAPARPHGRKGKPASRLASLVTEPLGPATGIVVAMGIVGPAFVIALNLGFRWSGDPTPAPLPDLLYPAIAVFIVCALLLVRSLRMSGARPRFSAADFDVFSIGERRTARHFAQRDRQRLEQLEANPATRKYAQMIRAGQQWSDDAIAYDSDPTMLFSCIHLQPIERAMRDSGTGIRLVGYGYLDAPCCVDPVKLAQRFTLGSTVHYYDIAGDRPGEPYASTITCNEHRQAIAVRFSPDAPPGTQWFPA